MTTSKWKLSLLFPLCIHVSAAWTRQSSKSGNQSIQNPCHPSLCSVPMASPTWYFHIHIFLLHGNTGSLRCWTLSTHTGASQITRHHYAVSFHPFTLLLMTRVSHACTVMVPSRHHAPSPVLMVEGGVVQHTFGSVSGCHGPETHSASRSSTSSTHGLRLAKLNSIPYFPRALFVSYFSCGCHKGLSKLLRKGLDTSPLVGKQQVSGRTCGMSNAIVSSYYYCCCYVVVIIVIVISVPGV